MIWPRFSKRGLSLITSSPHAFSSLPPSPWGSNWIPIPLQGGDIKVSSLLVGKNPGRARSQLSCPWTKFPNCTMMVRIDCKALLPFSMDALCTRWVTEMRGARFLITVEFNVRPSLSSRLSCHTWPTRSRLAWVFWDIIGTENRRLSIIGSVRDLLPFKNNTI